ncbi:MAG: zinc ribbon domain-containing protein [Elusimicrobiota bacterium]|nr:zinc ribbon domain-containing protein [Endomicrobiia bacterium]MDW8166207.1 zinc ribbon domain-containing protein [Elusimicrobiota bacterium]
MPIYEYKCNKCGNEFELLLFSGEEAVCPKCGEKNLTKKISLVSFHSEGDITSSDFSSNSTSSCSTCSSKNCSTCR